jgi:hypothetical protein
MLDTTCLAIPRGTMSFVNDIVSEDKQFLSYQEFQNQCMIRTNILEYYGIVGAVPKEWENIFGFCTDSA